jgi:protein-tyrosine kinase
VLCDLPPAFVSDDAVTIVERLDSYIHVIDEGITPRRQVEELRAMMAPKACLGAILNRYSGGWNDSYGYAAARKYSRYYDDPKR